MLSNTLSDGTESSDGNSGGGSAAQPLAPYQPREPKHVRVIEYDMTDFFESCVTLYAELTNTDPATYPAAGTPFGPELTSFQDGQDGPRGEFIPPAEEALAAAHRDARALWAPAGPVAVLPWPASVLVNDLSL